MSRITQTNGFAEIKYFNRTYSCTRDTLKHDGASLSSQGSVDQIAGEVGSLSRQ